MESAGNTCRGWAPLTCIKCKLDSRRLDDLRINKYFFTVMLRLDSNNSEQLQPKLTKCREEALEEESGLAMQSNLGK